MPSVILVAKEISSSLSTTVKVLLKSTSRRGVNEGFLPGAMSAEPSKEPGGEAAGFESLFSKLSMLGADDGWVVLSMAHEESQSEDISSSWSERTPNGL